jgi:iron complex transport system substrate-binding protein
MRFIVNRQTIVAASMAAVLSFSAVAGVAMAAEGTSTSGSSTAAATETETTSVSLSCTSGETRTVTDMNGDEVQIPVEVTKVAPAIGAFAQVTAMLDPTHGDETVAGTTSAQTNVFNEVFPNCNKEQNDSSNVEELIAAGVQVAFGPAGMYSDEQLEQLAAANIAYVALGIKNVEALNQSILTIGQIMGDEEYATAQAFSEYYMGWIEKGTELTADIADEDKPTVMQLRISGGEYTTCNSSDVCESYFTAAGAVNVASDYAGEGNGTALTVSAEQVLEWNPQYIFVMYNEAKDEIMADEALAEVDAVKNGNVIVIPSGAYYWNVRAGEGALMTPWLLTVLHPDLVSDLDMTQEVKDFYSTYYGYELTDEQTAGILDGTWNETESESK